jgi:hypothetical protein
MNRNVRLGLFALMICMVLIVGAASAVKAPAPKPTITFTKIANPYVYGKVTGVSPTSYEVAVYIYVPGYGWVNKPYWASPRTTIKADGTFICKYVTGGHDWDANQFYAFLVPKGTAVPILKGVPTLPSSLFKYPYTYFRIPIG